MDRFHAKPIVIHEPRSRERSVRGTGTGVREVDTRSISGADGLMQRRGLEYTMSAKLDQHELVTLLTPILEHHPSTSRVYEHLSGPVYGLVPDQIHMLLVTLLVMGEIDIIKGNKSYREMYETLSNPIQYDKIVPGRALNTTQLRDLQTLAEGFGVRVPKQWSVLAQRRAIEQLKREGRKQRDQASEFLMKLNANGEAGELPAEIEKFIDQWVALEKGENELQGFQHFLFEIGSPRAFVVRAKELTTLPDRFERLLREAQRFKHLFDYPCIAECANADLAVGLRRWASLRRLRILKRSRSGSFRLATCINSTRAGIGRNTMRGGLPRGNIRSGPIAGPRWRAASTWRSRN